MIKCSIDRKAKLIDYFDEHWYDVGNNVILPSVTSILDKTLSKGYGFNQWLMNTGNESKVIAREAAESGSKLHNAIENLINGGTVSAELGNYTKEEWKKLNDWVNWYKTLKIKPISTETTVFDEELGYAGTADFICKINGEVWLLDWKTGNSIHDTAYLQVASYWHAWNLRNKPKIQRCGVVHVGASIRTAKDLNNVGIKVEEVDFERDFEIFKNTLVIYKRLCPNDKAPTSVYPLELSLESEVKDEING